MLEKHWDTVFTGSKEGTHPKTLSEGRSGLGASVADLAADGAAVSLSNYQWHADLFIIVCTCDNTLNDKAES